MLLLVLFVCKGVGGVLGVRLGVGCPYPPVRNDIVTPHSLVHESHNHQEQIAHSYIFDFSIFVSSPYVNCSSDGVLSIFYCTCKRKRLRNFCVLVSSRVACP